MSIEIDVENGTVTISDLEIDNSNLATYLAQQDDPEFAFSELVNTAMRIRSQFVTDLETQNIADAAEQVIEEFDEKFADAVKELNNKFNELIDPKKGAIVTNLDNITKDKLTNLLTPDFDPDNIANASPIAQLRMGLLRDLKLMIADVQSPINDIHAKLGLSGGVKKDARAGDEFEDKVDDILQQIARTHGDTAQPVGTVAENGRSKKGDTLVTLNTDDTRSIDCKVAWEMKTEAKFKSDKKVQSPRVIDDQVIIELNKVIENRGATAAVLVLDSDRLAMIKQATWREYGGNKLLIVVDRFAPSPDLIQLAYLWSRWRARVSLDKFTTTVDEEGIRDTIKQIQLKLQLITNSKKNQNLAIDLLNKSVGFLNDYRKDTKNSFVALSEMINIEYEEVPENDEPATVTEIA